MVRIKPDFANTNNLLNSTPKVKISYFYSGAFWKKKQSKTKRTANVLYNAENRKTKTVKRSAVVRGRRKQEGHQASAGMGKHPTLDVLIGHSPVEKWAKPDGRTAERT